MKRFFFGIFIILTQFQIWSQEVVSTQQDSLLVFVYDHPDFDINKWYVELNDSVKDIDSNYYHTIKLGTQIWMKENLKVTKYNDGKVIPYIQNKSEWINLNTDGYSILNNDTVNPKYYYNYKVVTNHSNVCPVDWRIPDSTDWRILENYSQTVNDDFFISYYPVNDTIHLRKNEINIWNSTIECLSFSNQAFGYRSGINGDFILVSDYGYWWSKSGTQIATAWARIFIDRGFGIDDIHLDDFVYVKYNYGFVENHGLSIRCIKE